MSTIQESTEDKSKPSEKKKKPAFLTEKVPPKQPLLDKAPDLYYEYATYFRNRQKYELAFDYFEKVFDPIVDIDYQQYSHEKVKKRQTVSLKPKIEMLTDLRAFDKARESIDLLKTVAAREVKTINKLENNIYREILLDEIISNENAKFKDSNLKISKVKTEKFDQMEDERKFDTKKKEKSESNKRKAASALTIITKIDQEIKTMLKERFKDQTRCVSTDPRHIVKRSEEILTYVSDQIKKKIVSKEEVTPYTNQLYKIIGLDFLENLKFNASWSVNENILLIKYYLGFCKLSLSPMEKLRLRKVNEFPINTKLTIQTITCSTDDFEICFLSSQLLRKKLFEYNHPKFGGEVKKLRVIANVGLCAAQRTKFIPWILISLVNILYCTVKIINTARFLNQMNDQLVYGCQVIGLGDIYKNLRSDDEDIELPNVSDTLCSIRQVLQMITDEQVHEFVNAIDKILQAELILKSIPRSSPYGKIQAEYLVTPDKWDLPFNFYNATQMKQNSN